MIPNKLYLLQIGYLLTQLACLTTTLQTNVLPERETMLILDPRPLLKSTSVDWNRSVAGVTVQLVGYETENLPCGSEYFVILGACAITGGGVVVELGLLDFVVLVACAITGG